MTAMSTGNMLHKMNALGHSVTTKIDTGTLNIIPTPKPTSLSKTVPSPAPEMAQVLANCLESPKNRNNIPR